MNKIFIALVAAMSCLVMAQNANAERVCRQVCDQGTCVSKCVDHPDSAVIIHDHDRFRDRGPGVDIHGPGVDVDVGR